METKTQTALKRIAWLSSRDSEKTFDCIMHHVNKESLERNYSGLKKNKAAGIDGVTKEEYGKNLESNIEDLLVRMRKMAYRPNPVKKVLIPKEGQPGKFRPLGISNFEDKVVQGTFQEILESIYEPIFLNCSYGFRPGRSCHTAIKDLRDHLDKNYIETVIDLDLKSFFDLVDHKILESFLREKVKDKTFMRYIIRMFKAGVLSEGDLQLNDEGVPQGSICSPILANIFAHYVIDEWIEKMVQPNCRGKVKLFRYADDCIICCQYETDAKRIRTTLPKRLGKFKLELNEEKSKMVTFSKYKARLGVKQETFDFLGFTFYLGTSRRGRIIPKLKTSGKTLRNKLKRVKEWAQKVTKRMRLMPLWKLFCSKLRGHIQYYGVSFNHRAVQTFIMQATRIIFKWLNRRSQRKSYTWENFGKFLKNFPLPQSRVKHKLF